MKLKNKQTPNKLGKIVPYDAGKDGGIAVKTDQGIVWYYHSLAELNEEWKDYEEPKEYWTIDMDGEVKRYALHSFNSQITENIKSIGNYFSSQEEAEKVVEKLKAWKRLKDKGFRFTAWYGGSKDISFSIPQEIIDKPTAKDLDLLFSQEDD